MASNKILTLGEQPSSEASTTDFGWMDVFDELKDAVFIHDCNFRILHCNAAYAALAELPTSEIVGKEYWRVFPKGQDALPCCIEAANHAQPVTRSEFTTDTGQVFLTHDITAHRADGDFWYSRHLMENITARKNLEDISRLKSSFTDAFIASAPGVFIVINKQGKLVRWNDGLNMLTALSDAELAEVSLPLLAVPEDREKVSLLLDKAFADAGAQGEFRFQNAQRKALEFMFSAQRFEVADDTYVVGSCTDMSEVKQLESALQREKAISDTIIESAPGAFFMVDQATNLVRWNQNLNEEAGLSDEQLRESSILSIIYEPDRPLAAAKFLVAFAVGYAQMEVRVLTPTGLRYFLKTAKRFIVDDVPYVAGFCFDVTDRKQTELALEQEKAFSDALVESVPGAFYVVDKEGNYYRWNSYLKKITGLTEAELHDQPSLLTIQPEDRALAAETMRKAFEHGYAQAELHLITQERGIRLYLLNARRFEVAGKSYLVGVGVDTTEWIEKMKVLEHEAWTDPLTQIANRGHFMELVQQEFSRCRRYGHSVSLWMMDVDHFKAVNDTHGHPVGDTILQTLVKTCGLILRDWDIIGRIGGEEFAVLLPETDPDKSFLVAERLRQAVAFDELKLESGATVQITVSIGIANIDESDTDIEALLKRADLALYEAKRTGRDKVCANKVIQPV